MNALSIGLIALVLAGCASGPSSPPMTSAETQELNRALANCRMAVANMPQQAAPTGPSPMFNQAAAANANRSAKQRYFDDCMQAQGCNR